MDWKTAIQYMRLGHTVQRKSQQFRHQTSEDTYMEGEEPICLADAYTADSTQVQVFQGTVSKVLFYPRPCQVAALDWVLMD